MSAIVSGNGRFKIDAIKTSSKKPSNKPIKHKDNLHAWANSYVCISACMSSALNAYANGLHATGGSQWASWALGASIPALVLILGRVAGLLHRRGYKVKGLTGVVGCIGVCLLGLSVFHCQEAIGLLSGSNCMLSTALAIGIDCGLVACEVVSVVSE